MKFSTSLLALTLLAVPALPAPAMAQAAAPAPKVVAHYTFDQGITTQGAIAETTGSGPVLHVRAQAGGKVSAVPASKGRYLTFPARCAATATADTCPRALLEGADDVDLDPDTAQFRYGAAVMISRAQLKNSSNVMQKGVSGLNSLWKLQIGATNGRAQCVVTGLNSTRAYIVRSSVSVVDGRWHRTHCMRTSRGLYVFVDGQQRGFVAVPATLRITNNRPLRVGGPNLALASDSFNGALDEVFVVRG